MSREESWVDVGAVRLHVVSQGDGDPIVLLHGFPEFWYSWRNQMDVLDRAGFRAIAPDLRGYNLSDKPAGLESYRVEQLVADVVGLLRTIGPGKVRLVGHDWGGTLAWYVASWHPELLDRLVIMNSPHPRLMARRLKTWAQRSRSWYMQFFKMPILPERVIATEWFMKTAIRDGAVNKARFTDEHMKRFAEAMQNPGAAAATLNWYRAALRFRGPELSKIRLPTLVIWGEKDKVLGPELLDGLDEEVEMLTVARLPDAGHWVQQDCPDEVNERLLAFLGEPRSRLRDPVDRSRLSP